MKPDSPTSRRTDLALEAQEGKSPPPPGNIVLRHFSVPLPFFPHTTTSSLLLPYSHTMANVAPTIDPSRAAKLDKLFFSVCRGKAPITNNSGTQYIESIYSNPNPVACLGTVVNSKQGLASLQLSVSFDLSPKFFAESEHWSSLASYLSKPEIKLLDSGSILARIVQTIVEPPTLWFAYCDAFENGALTTEASQKSFAWFLLQVISLPQDLMCRDLEQEQDLLNQLLSSEFADIRNIAQKIHASLFGLSAVANAPNGPGGRHDNDFIDHREISIVPTPDEVSSTEPPFLQRITDIERAGNENTREEEYLDNLFRLLREDMLYEMREELQIALGKAKGRKHRGTVLKGLQLHDLYCGDPQRRVKWCLSFSCSLAGVFAGWAPMSMRERKKTLEQNRKFLKDRSLCCLLVDKQLVAFATIQRNEPLLCLETPLVLLQLQGHKSPVDALLKFKNVPATGDGVTLIQIDAALFAYEPTLLALQSMRSVPLREEVLFWKSDDTPRIIDDMEYKLETIVTKLKCNPSSDLRPLLGLSSTVSLDKAQSDSFLAGLTQKVSLIQGPPGTGKSFIGALLAKAIYDCTSHTILVVCYTNHALDQFLEDLVKIGIPESEMLRLGGRPSDATASMSIRNKPKLRGHVCGATVGELKHQAQTLYASANASFAKYKNTAVDLKEIMLHLEFDDQAFYEAFEIPLPDEDGMEVVGKHNKAAEKTYLLERWMQNEGPGAFASHVLPTYKGVWSMPPEARAKKVKEWKDTILRDQVDTLYRSLKMYDKTQEQLMNEFDQNTIAVIQSVRIVACTTTGAAINFSKLREAPAQVLLVEEAGEILESHVITSLGADAEQMILIGDHKQLRPKVNNYELTVEKDNGYDLNRSLFERLVLKDYPHQVLVQQHRMRPEISAMVRLLTYPDLQDAPKTANRPPLKGVPDTVVFVNHAHLEGDLAGIGDSQDAGSKTSKQNSYEVTMVWRIVHYLLQQGYSTDCMVVLTPYLGQLTKLKKELEKEVDAILNDLDSDELKRAGLYNPSPMRNSKSLRLATIDNYQGEESDIVIVSLTRSNKNNDIGFMFSPERVNVLLSRARNALIMVGNADTFTKSRKGGALWTKLVDYLKQEKHFYEGFPTQCQVHPAEMALLSTATDFEKWCPDGGCSIPCGVMLSCQKHRCPAKCHPTVDHSQIHCASPVSATCPLGHNMSYKCSQPRPESCKTCEKEAQKVLRQQAAALQRKEQQEREKEEHERHLARVEERILAEAQRVQDAQLAHDREIALEMKKKDLEAAKNFADNFTPTSQTAGHVSSLPSLFAGFMSSVTRPKSTPTTAISGPTAGSSSLATPPSSGSQPSSSTTSTNATAAATASQAPPTSSTSSQSSTNGSPTSEGPEHEWQRRKDIHGASNQPMDAVMEMIGLKEVKQKMLGILDKIELVKRQHASIKDERFNISLLGNPGTGKTTVARHYARFLASQDLLDGNLFHETTGSLLASKGVPGAEKVVKDLLAGGGGAMFIDEAYQLVSKGNTAGGQVLDYLLAEMENNVGKIVFILAGYNKEMEAFFEHNPGLPSRVPHTLQFVDYTDEELMKMMQSKLGKKFPSGIKAEDGLEGLYMRIAIRRLGRGRGKPGFGNARALEILLQRITDRQSRRIGKSRREGKAEDDLLLSKEDIIGPNPSDVLPQSKAWKQLKELIGLSSVKQSVADLFDIIEINYRRELEEKKPLELTLNRVFLGSPGTGKTTVAKLYGQILADLGLLSNGEVVTKNPSDFIGAYVGHSEENTKKILQSTLGKVLIIDEAYMLYGGGTKNAGSAHTDTFKTGVIDTIVAEVQNVPGDDRCVLMLGYEAQMTEMFQNVNPGLSRRFAIEDGFRFEDFDDVELMQILDLKMKEQEVTATNRAKEVALEVLGRERNRPNFGNGGAVENLLVRAKSRYIPRARKDPTTQLQPADFDPDFDRHLKAAENLDKLFSDIVGCQDIKDKLRGYQKIAKLTKERGGDSKKLIPTNFIFKGPPGTGKTTVARKFGQVYYDMGFLSSTDVYECAATDLVGQYVGHTGPKTQQVFEKALGRVLFIDEAYRLGDGRFAQEAVDEMVGLLTQPRFFQKIVVILAGYDEDMNKLLAVNSGLSSRFPEEIMFHHFDPAACLDILQNELNKQGVSLPDLHDHTSPGYGYLRAMVDRLRLSPGWGNARDMITLSKKMINTALQNLPDDAATNATLSLTAQDALKIMSDLLQERRARAAGVTTDPRTTRLSSLPEATSSPSSGPPPTTASSSSSSAAPPPPPPASPPPASSPPPSSSPASPPSRVASPSVKLPGTPKSSRPGTPGSPPPATHSRQASRVQIPKPRASQVSAVDGVQRDPSVSNNEWNNLEQCKKAEAAARAKADEELAKAQAALAKAAADQEKARQAARQRALAVQRAKDEAERQRRLKEEARAQELERQRKAERARIEKLLREKKEREAKEKAEEQWKQQKLRSMGVCVQGFQWIKMGNGYRCAGGAHFVHASQL